MGVHDFAAQLDAALFEKLAVNNRMLLGDFSARTPSAGIESPRPTRILSRVVALLALEIATHLTGVAFQKTLDSFASHFLDKGCEVWR